MPTSNPTETIDSRILRLIGLEDVFDLDYETYFNELREALVKANMPGKSIPAEEFQLLKDELKRIRSKKDNGRFTVKKKKISATSFSVPNKNLGKNPPKALPGTAIGQSPIVKSVESDLATITSTMVSIVETLKLQKKNDDAVNENERKKAEREKRGLAESKLEKVFRGIAKTAEKIIAPVKSLLDRVLEFIGTVILGRIVYKIVEWMGDPANQGKVKSIIRFFTDWGPTLLSLYIVFGTSFGKFARGLISLVIKSTIRLGAAVAALAVKAGVGKAGGKLSKVAGFLGGKKGKLLAAGLEAGATVVGTMALSNTLKGGGEQSKSQGFKGGGYVRPRFPTFSGGGFNFSGMMSGAAMGSMFGPLGMLLGGAFGSGKAQEAMSGFVSGEKGVDKVPAMLSDGEFVMSVGAVQKYGVDTLEKMNAAGGGTNKPKIMSGTTYAQGGGLVGLDNKSDPSYRKNESALEKQKKEENNLIQSLQKYTKTVASGGDKTLIKALNDLSSSLKGKGPSGVSGGGVPTGSLLTNPLGAIQRMTGMKGGGMKLPKLPGGIRLPKVPSGGIKLPGMPGPVQEVIDKLKGPGAATYRDAGMIYARQMLGGFGGPVSERDLSKESQAELQKAIQRAKKRTGSEIAKAEAKIKELEASGASKTAEGKSALATQRSFLKKLKAGGIRVQYTDYADEKGKMSESAKNAKNILGQFWATQRSKKEGGGYRIEDKYDFDMFKKKDAKTGKVREMTGGELWNEGVLGKGKTIQQRLQAAYLLNPFRGKGDVDMVLGGKRTAAESFGLSASKTLLGGMLGISGKPQAQVGKPKPKTLPVKPPVRTATVMQGQTAVTMYGANDPRRKNRASSTPKFGASCPKGGNKKQKILGIF